MTSPEEILKGSQKERSQESSEDLGGATDKKSKEQELEKAMSGMRLDTPVQEQKTCVASSMSSICKGSPRQRLMLVNQGVLSCLLAVSRCLKGHLLEAQTTFQITITAMRLYLALPADLPRRKAV